MGESAKRRDDAEASEDVSFVAAENNNPAKSEVWTLTQGGDVLAVGWRKGSRWISVSNAESGETNAVHLTAEQTRQLGRIIRWNL